MELLKSLLIQLRRSALTVVLKQRKFNPPLDSGRNKTSPLILSVLFFHRNANSLFLRLQNNCFWNRKHLNAGVDSKQSSFANSVRSNIVLCFHLSYFYMKIVVIFSSFIMGKNVPRNLMGSFGHSNLKVWSCLCSARLSTDPQSRTCFK